MKKILVLLTILLTATLVLIFKPNASSKYLTVGIIQIVEHPALDVTRKGFIQKLKDLGFEHGKNIQIQYESAQGNPALAAQISQKFVGQNVDLIVTLGTTPSQAALQNIMQAKNQKKIPLIFLSVSDPLSARLVDLKDNGLAPSSEYACGISNYVEAQKQISFLKKALPNLLNIGIIYNPGEANSVSSIEKFTEFSPSFGVNIIPVPAHKTADVIMAAQSLLSKADAILVDNDNTALAAFASLSDFCLKNKMPLFVSDVDLAHLAMGALGADQTRIGEQGAQFAALLLRKESLPQDLGVQYPDKVDLVLNKLYAKKIEKPYDQKLENEADKIICN
ncbi:MAG: hypothetical protein NEHIOOID_00445 [Holosporales bacterium]